MMNDIIKATEKQPVSLCMILKDEAKRIDKCLKKISRIVDEVLVLDTGSEDDTVEKVKTYGAQVFTFDWDNDFSKARNMLRDRATNDWLLWIDGDEFFSHELIQEICEKLNSNSEVAGYFFPRKNYFFGTWMKNGGNYPNYQLKMFKKSQSSPYEYRVHEKVQLKGTIEFMSHPIDHYPYDSVESYFNKFNHYTSLDALKLKDKNVRINVGNTIVWLLIKPILRFTRRYILKQGFRDGFPGFFAIVFDVAGYIVRYIKLWELEKQQKEQ